MPKPKKYYYGTADDDSIDGTSATDDFIYAGEGNDSLNGLDGDDVIYGEDGDDFLWGAWGNDILIGGDGHDRIYGVFGVDIISGDDGNDWLNGGAEGDLIFGGAGSDTSVYNASHEGVSVSLLTGYSAGGDATGDQLDSIENLIGSSYGDNLSGDHDENDLDGGGGADLLFGFGGDDKLEGGSDDDDLYGGEGNDLLNGEAGFDQLYGGTGNDVLGDTGFGDDELYGQFGDDWLDGGYGADVINGGSGSDTAVYMQSNAAVTIDLSVALATGGHAEGDTLSGIENLYGSAYNDHLSGDAGANTLAGGKGTDLLKGNGGADVFRINPSGAYLGRDADRILDFSRAEDDQIFLGPYTAFGDPDYQFIGTNEFTGQIGEVRYQQVGGNTWVSADITGDAQADFQILCVGTINFTAADFLW